MERTLSETQVLRQLGIPDFRHLSRDKVVSFVSALPQMEPEVAKRALEQFPAFAETGLAIVRCLENSLQTVVDSDSANMVEFNAQCREALEALKAILKRDDLSDESLKAVVDGILSVVDLMSRKDTESKAHRAGLFRDLLLGVGFVFLCLSVPMGLRLHSSAAG